MSMLNKHRNAEHTNRPFSFKPNAASIVAFCRTSNSWEAPNAELDMFSRWIRLSDRALAGNHNTRKPSASRGRGKCKTVLSAKPV